MKFILPLTISLASLCASCASSSQPNAQNSASAKIDPAEQPPFVGMTKAQALARYGEPKTHTITDEGEQWTYLLNFGEMMGKAFIPFNFKPTMPRTGVLIFAADGKISKFRWDAETNG